MRCFIQAMRVSAACLFAPCAWAQAPELSASAVADDVIVECVPAEQAGATPMLRAHWRGVSSPAPAFEWQRPSHSSAVSTVMLDRILEAGIGAYLDARIHFTKVGVRSDLPAVQLVRGIEAMIAAASTSLGIETGFTGLTASTAEQVKRVTGIDWSQARFGVDGGAEQDKYVAIYYYVRSQRQELERQLRADLLPFGTVAFGVDQELPPGQTLRINSTCGTVFDDQNFLCALDLRLADSGEGLGYEPTLSSRTIDALVNRSTEPHVTGQPARIRKRDRWLKQELDVINERIDRLDQRKELWELRDRMDDMQDRITSVELEVQGLRDQASGDNPSANLADLTGRNITVRFERNSTALLPDQRVLLNEVFEQLARASKDKVLITGYTDRSGDPARNLWLSEQRAKAVRGYLLARGISAERLLVNYYGDSRSLGREPGERRVEVEWLR